jgi:hypothetical protein
LGGVTIHSNCEPRTGGQLVLYSGAFTSPKKRLVFINGIYNSPQNHQSAAKSLCRLTGCEVLGVYNRTGLNGHLVDPSALDNVLNFMFDVEQAAADWIGVALRATVMNSSYMANGCASSLYSLLLWEGMRWPSRPLCIVAHSQGNLITANALALYSKMVTKYKLMHPNIHVFAVASPAISWPTNSFIKVDSYSHGNDVVPALSMWRNTRGNNRGEGAKTDESFSHELTSYLDDRTLVEAICKKVGSKSPF